MPKRIRWDESASAAANARRILPGLVIEYCARGRKLVAQAHLSSGDLHRFRLRTKRVRYTLELFRACYGPALDRVCLEPLREIQSLLGDINDCPTAEAVCAALLPPKSPAQAKLKTYLERRQQRKTAEFRRAWNQLIEPQEPRWQRMLATGARDR